MGVAAPIPGCQGNLPDQRNRGEGNLPTPRPALVSQVETSALLALHDCLGPQARWVLARNCSAVCNLWLVAEDRRDQAFFLLQVIIANKFGCRAILVLRESGGCFKMWAHEISTPLGDGLYYGQAGIADGREVGVWRMPEAAFR